jgi:hypothetical protein
MMHEAAAAWLLEGSELLQLRFTLSHPTPWRKASGSQLTRDAGPNHQESIAGEAG